MNNLEIWERVEQPPDWALKTIGGGRLKGKTDINPQWRFRAVTEVFGPCGQGWWYTIDKQWLEPGPTEEVCAFVNVTLYTEQCPKGIPGTGGSMFVAQEKSGLYVSDEAYKMATTDALSVAMKALGVAAKIYYGAEATKYSPQGKDRPAEKKQAPPDPPAADRVKALKAFHAAWDEVIAEVEDGDEVDAKCRLEHYFLYAKEGDRAVSFDAKHDYMRPLKAEQIDKLTDILRHKKADVVGWLESDDVRESVGLPKVSVETCAGCAAILSPADKEKSDMVKLPKGYCEACRPDATVAMMKKKREGTAASESTGVPA